MNQGVGWGVVGLAHASADLSVRLVPRGFKVNGSGWGRRQDPQNRSQLMVPTGKVKGKRPKRK